MAETPDGIELMRTRMARAQRVPPPPRAAQPEAEPAPVTSPPNTPAAPPRRATTTPTPPVRRVRLGADEGLVNLSIRVRRPLDEHLVEALHRLRRAGVRSSKVELIELLLWDLPADPATLRARLAEFRQAAPRGGDGLSGP